MITFSPSPNVGSRTPKQVHAQRRVEHRRDGEQQGDEEPVAHVALHRRRHAGVGHVVAHMVAVVRMVWRGSLVLHPVVLGPHRDGLRVHAVFEVLHSPLGRRHGLVVVLLLDLGRLAVAARLRDHLLDIFRADPRWVVADVDEVVLPVQPHVGDVRLLSQGSLDGVGAAQAVHAPELERAACARRNMRGHRLLSWLWGRYLVMVATPPQNASTSSLAPHSHRTASVGMSAGDTRNRHDAPRAMVVHRSLAQRWRSASTFRMICVLIVSPWDLAFLVPLLPPAASSARSPVSGRSRCSLRAPLSVGSRSSRLATCAISMADWW